MSHSHLPQESFQITLMVPLQRSAVFSLNLNFRGALIERAHYYAILVEEGRTIREGLIIEEGALTREYGN